MGIRFLKTWASPQSAAANSQGERNKMSRLATAEVLAIRQQYEDGEAVADIAAQHGRTVIMEPRVGEVISNADSLRRLVDDVDRDNFRANFDTAHLCAHRENIPIALTKLKDRFANIHIADND